MTQATIQSGSVYGELALLAQQHDESLFEVWESLGLSEKDVTVLAQNDLYAARSGGRRGFRALPSGRGAENAVRPAVS